MSASIRHLRSAADQQTGVATGYRRDRWPKPRNSADHVIHLLPKSYTLGLGNAEEPTRHLTSLQSVTRCRGRSMESAWLASVMVSMLRMGPPLGVIVYESSLVQFIITPLIC